MSWIWPDIADEREAIAAAEPALWTSILLAVINFLSPIVGILTGVVYSAIAFGIWRKKVGAAMAGLLCLAVYGALALYLLATSALLSVQIGLGLVLLVPVAFAAIFLRGLRALQRFHEIRSSPVPERRAIRPVWLLAPLLIALIRFPIFISPYSMPTRSMEPTLEIGDHFFTELLSGRLGSPPVRGDMVVFRYPKDPSQTHVKRVVGIPGDQIQIIHKELWINRAQAREPYVVHTSEYLDPYRDNFPEGANDELPVAAKEMIASHVVEGELVVPPDSYFVLGDNRDHSLDSRYFGFITQDDILGSPLFVYWSNDPETESTRWDRTPKIIRGYELTTK